MASWIDVRRIARRLGDAEETTSYGKPCFKVAGKSFVWMSPHEPGALVIEAVDDGGSDAVDLIDRPELGRDDVVDEAVRLPRRIGVGADDVAEVVQAERLRERRRRVIDGDQRLPERNPEPMGHAGCCGVEAGHVALVVDAGRLRARSRGRDRPEDAALDGIGVLDAFGVLPIARRDSVVIQAEELVEHSVREVNRGVDATHPEKPVGPVVDVEVEAGRIAFGVDCHHLGLERARVVLVGECAPDVDLEALVGVLGVSAAAVISDHHAGIVGVASYSGGLGGLNRLEESMTIRPARPVPDTQSYRLVLASKKRKR